MGKKRTVEQRQKISKTRIEKGVAKGENNPMFGKHHSTVAKDKMRLTALKNMKYRGRLETSSLEIETTLSTACGFAIWGSNFETSIYLFGRRLSSQIRLIINIKQF